MSKKLLALLLAMAMVLSVLPFSVFADDEVVEGDTPVVEETVDLTYSSGLDDGATYALKVPTNKDTFGQAYQWTTDGYNMNIRHEEKESFILYDEKAFDSILWSKDRKEFNVSIYAAGTTYGGDELAKKNEYKGGVPETADISNTKYLAIRIKHIDNNPVGTYDVTRFKPYISCGGQYGLHGTTTDIPAYWYDLTDGTYNTWYGNNGFWKATEGAFQFVGDADGYIIIPYAINSSVTAEKIASSFTNIQFFFYESDAVTSGDNQRKKASFKNKEFLIGDAFFIEDVEKFVTARNADRGITRYSSGKNDGAWIATKVNGATRNTVRGWAWVGGKAFCDPFTDANSSSYNYAHAATISEDEIGIVFKINEGKTSGGNFSVPLNGTYETSRHATDKFQSKDGIPAEIDLSKMTYLAQRMVVKGSEENPLNGQGFRLYLNNGSQAHCASAAEIILINKDKTITKVKYNGGLDFYEDFDGWILVPMSGWSEAYWADAYTTWSGGFQFFFDGTITGNTFIAGNLYFVEDAVKFYQFHGAPALDVEAGTDSLTVKDVEEGAIYSIDGFETSNTTGVFEGLEKDAKYTISAKYEIGSAVVEKEIWTDPFATHVQDSGYNFMPVPNEPCYIRHGKGMGWSSSWFWRNYQTGEYQPDNQSGNAAIFVEDVDGETFINLTMNPANYEGKALPLCPNHAMVPNQLATGTNSFTNTAYDDSEMTHLAFRFKLTGLAEGKTAKLGILTDYAYFFDCSTAYLVDYETREVIDPEWTGETVNFTKNFDGWVVFPIDDMGSDTVKEYTYKVTDENGEPVMVEGEDGTLVQATDKYSLTFRDSLFGRAPEPKGTEKNTMNNFQFWFHNDDETNDDGVGNEGCGSHWVRDSDWRGATLYMGDWVVFSDKETFDAARTSCDLHGHDLVAGDITAPTCDTEGFTTYTCKYCDHTEDKDFVEALGHEWESTVVEPDCENGGYTEYNCPVCGTNFQEAFTDPLGHTLVIIDETPATCTEGGYIMEMCEICGYTDEYETVPNGHAWDEGVATAPNCTDKGFTTFTCATCGETEIKDEVDALGHKYVDTVVPPTTEAQGYTEHTCEVCGDNYKDNYTDPVQPEEPEDPEEPEVPTNRVNNVVVTPSDVDVTVTWDSFDGADRYLVRALNADGTTFNTQTITDGSNTAVFKGLEYNTEYTFFVIARAGGKYQSVDDAEKIVSGLVIGDRVVGIKSSVKGRTITVSWLEYPGATNYYVMVFPKDADPTNNANRVTTVNAGTATTVGVINVIAPEVDYDIYVTARVNGKYMTFENALYTSAIIPVTAPNSFEVTSIEPTVFRIKWNAVKGADRYWARIVDEKGNIVKNRECAKALTSFTGLTPGATYYVQLQARVPKAKGGYQYSGFCDLIMTQPVTLPLA